MLIVIVHYSNGSIANSTVQGKTKAQELFLICWSPNVSEKQTQLCKTTGLLYAQFSCLQAYNYSSSRAPHLFIALTASETSARIPVTRALFTLLTLSFHFPWNISRENEIKKWGYIRSIHSVSSSCYCWQHKKKHYKCWLFWGILGNDDAQELGKYSLIPQSL